MTNAKHSSASNEHYTPPEIVEAARKVMGGIDLDPASCETANRIVKARSIFTKFEDGLTQDWFGKVWLNPPGGRVGNRSSAAIWWDKLAQEWLAGRVKEAVFLGFSLEILQTTQWCATWPGSAPFCIPKKRIQFLQHDGDSFVPGESPTHANVIVYLPDYSGFPGEYPTADFKREFERFGMVRL